MTAADTVLAGLDYPMVVVTAADGEDRGGCLVGFHTQCSIDPLRYLVCVSQANRTYAVAVRSTHLAVHFLTPDDRALAHLFGEETGDDVDKFGQCEWAPGPSGVPLLATQGGRLVGPVVARLPAGDHLAMVIEPTDAAPRTGVGQYGYGMARDLDAAHPA
jgi:flavin reductase (DIM6/NTAB) family NADH-FMN oxidoreductase RutF